MQCAAQKKQQAGLKRDIFGVTFEALLIEPLDVRNTDTVVFTVSNIKPARVLMQTYVEFVSLMSAALSVLTGVV